MWGSLNEIPGPKVSSRRRNDNILPFRPRAQGPAVNADVTFSNEELRSELGDKKQSGELTGEIRHDPFVAAIVQDTSVPSLFHCIVQRFAEVLFWGQFRTQREAEEAAETELDYLVRSEDAA